MHFSYSSVFTSIYFSLCRKNIIKFIIYCDILVQHISIIAIHMCLNMYKAPDCSVEHDDGLCLSKMF